HNLAAVNGNCERIFCRCGCRGSIQKKKQYEKKSTHPHQCYQCVRGWLRYRSLRKGNNIEFRSQTAKAIGLWYKASKITKVQASKQYLPLANWQDQRPCPTNERHKCRSKFPESLKLPSLKFREAYQ